MLSATVLRADGYAFLGKSNSNHWVAMDGSQKIGAEDGAVRPKELILLGLAGCTAFDVEMFLRKRRLEVTDLRIEAEADEAPDHPMVFTRIRLVYRVEGAKLPAKDVERAIHVSEDSLCSVSAMLRKAVPIEWRAILNGEEIASGGVEG